MRAGMRGDKCSTSREAASRAPCIFHHSSSPCPPPPRDGGDSPDMVSKLQLALSAASLYNLSKFLFPRIRLSLEEEEEEEVFITNR